MAIAAAGILYPIRFAATSYVVRVTSGASTANLTLGSLTVGRDYWLSGDDQADSSDGNGDLLRYFEEALNTNAGGLVYVVTLAPATNVVTITASGGNFSILWSHGSTTLDPTIFGFTASDTASGTAVTAPNATQGAWLPGRPPQIDRRNRVPVVGGVARALSGLQRTSRLTTGYAERDIMFGLLPEAKALREYEAATDPYGSAEEMWLSAGSLGRVLRYYPDTTSRTSSGYTAYRSRDLRDPVSRQDPATALRWQVDLRLVGVA